MQPPDPSGGRTTDDGDAIASPRTERMQIRASEMGSALSAAPGLSDNLAMATDLPHHMALGPGDNPSTSSVPARDTMSRAHVDGQRERKNHTHQGWMHASHKTL